VEQSQNLLVEFYAPWCGHCKALAPDYERAAKILKTNPDAKDARLAKCDATQNVNKELASHHGVQGFPTMKLFHGQNVVDYTGGRAATDIVAWMLRRIGDACVKLPDITVAESFVAQKDVRVVCTKAADGKDIKDIQETVEAVARTIEDVRFAVTDNAEVAKRIISVPPSCVLLKEHDDKRAVLDGTPTVESLTKFVRTEKEPLVQVFSQEKSAQIFGAETQVHFLLFLEISHKDTANMRSALTNVAKQNRGRSLHVIMPSDQTDVMQYFGLKAADLPIAIIMSMKDGMKQYRMAATGSSMDEKSMLEFEGSFHAGTLKPHLKSADPVDDKADPVKTIVGSNFQERVMQGAQDVLLEFYAPWCGHCKALAPKFQQVGVKLQGVADKIIVGQMDATENDVDHDKIKIEGFPTIMFFKAGAKEEPIDFTGPREVGDMLDFVKKHASFDLDKVKGAGKNDEL